MIVYGKNTTKEVILEKRHIYKVYLDNKFQDKSILNLLKEHKIKFKYVSKHELNLLTNDGVHQGIVMEVEDYQFLALDDLINNNFKNILLLDKVSDPQNLGAIIRTSEAFKIDAIIIAKKGQTQITPLVSKIASGALEHVNIVLVDNLHKTVLKLKEANYLIIGSSLDATKTVKELPKAEKRCLIAGSEGFGMSYMLKKESDVLIKIPMLGSINSLNVSVATGILIYELMNN